MAFHTSERCNELEIMIIELLINCMCLFIYLFIWATWIANALFTLDMFIAQ